MTDNTESPLLATLASSVDEGEVFEIFQQGPRDAFPHHGGNLRASGRELAIHYAREFYGRRQESLKLWIIPRVSLLEIRYDPALSENSQPEPQPASVAAQPVTFEVFAQQQPARPLIWLQTLTANNQAAAQIEALNLLREGDGAYLRLWLCPLDAITVLDNPDLLQPPIDRSYRRLDGYDIREKLQLARQRVRAQEER
ncbi:hypothetical protein [Dictyobacter kobayashii]|uniref:Phenylacetic acid degradation protein n=1 Tax=Dictyobacter kobayashii TaxID=2014872 RepID=A0A402AN31_9CHLR|nr:hypothetical protein [Dictyobacter kobayashii]GCE20526.1 hypothetical protein KDK_43260 [Dictyobacter kobayashii]